MGGLNTLQLTLALRKHAQTDSQFVVVFARDELPLIIDKIPDIIIANTDPSTKSGSHWILFYFHNNGNVEYFDSLGKTLSHYHYLIIIKTDKNNSNNYSRVVKKRIQPVNTTSCGQYCLYYASSRCVEKINKEQIINNMPSADWIKCCISFLFELPEIITECQCCTKCL